MARKYSERIENMDEASRKELDDRIREYCNKNGWQKALAKYKPSPSQLSAIVAGKDPTKIKVKRKPKAEGVEAKAPKKVAKKKGKKVSKKAPKKVSNAGKKAAEAADTVVAKRKPGRPKGSGKKSAGTNGVVTKTNTKGDLIIEGKIGAAQFVQLVLNHSERMMKLAMSS